MSQHITKIICLGLFLFFFTASTMSLADCQPNADPTAMDQVFQAYLKSLTKKSKDSIAIAPFHNLQGLQADPIMTDGMPFLIYNMFSSANKHFVHPYLTLAAAREAGWHDEALTEVTNMQSLSQKIGARFVIFGSVQRSTSSVVRVILRVYDAKEKSARTAPVQFATELNDAFFSLTRQKIQELLHGVKTKINSDVTHADPSLQAYRFYVRGMQLSDHHNSTNLNIAALWFEKALKENYQNYDDAALGLARSYFMLSLIEKLNKVDFAQNLIKARHALSELRTTQTEAPKYQLVLRYNDGATAFMNALTAHKNRNHKIAADQSIKAVNATPEDGLAVQLGIASGAPSAKFVVHPPVCL